MLTAAGHDVVETTIRYDNRYPDAFTTAWTAGVGAARIPPQREALLAPLTRTFRRRAQQRSASKLNESLALLRQFQRDTVAQYAAWDLILTPSLAQTPRPVGWFTGSPTVTATGRCRSGPATPTATTASSASSRHGPPW